MIIRVGQATVVTKGNTAALHTSHIMKLLQQFPLHTTPPDLFPHAPLPPQYFLLFIQRCSKKNVLLIFKFI
jgi:hypothetical protein